MKNGKEKKPDEYDDSKSLIHISELAASWVRNIRIYVREQKMKNDKNGR